MTAPPGVVQAQSGWKPTQGNFTQGQTYSRVIAVIFYFQLRLSVSRISSVLVFPSLQKYKFLSVLVESALTWELIADFLVSIAM